MQLPNARREGLIVEELSDETLVYDLNTHKAHSLNPTAALVWRHCDGRTSLRDIACIMHDELKAPVSEDLVILALDRLQSAKLLSGPASVVSGVSRRDAMKKFALVGGLTLLLPVVHSIVAPTPAQAQTCVGSGTQGPGTPCTSNAQCCSGFCNLGTLTCT